MLVDAVQNGWEVVFDWVSGQQIISGMPLFSEDHERLVWNFKFGELLVPEDRIANANVLRQEESWKFQSGGEGRSTVSGESKEKSPEGVVGIGTE